MVRDAQLICDNSSNNDFTTVRKITKNEIDIMLAQLCSEGKVAPEQSRFTTPVKNFKKEIKSHHRHSSVSKEVLSSDSENKDKFKVSAERIDFEVFKRFIVRLAQKCLPTI